MQAQSLKNDKTFTNITACISVKICQQKTLVKIVRHLRDDLKRRHPNEKMPSTWVIKSLVSSCYSMQDQQGGVWHDKLIALLMILREKSFGESPNQAHPCLTLRKYPQSSKTYLPTIEHFDIEDIGRFAQLGLSYLAVKSDTQ